MFEFNSSGIIQLIRFFDSMISLRHLLMATILTGAAALMIVSPQAMPSDLVMPAALVLVTIGMLATGVLAEQLVILFFFLFSMVMVIAPAATVFSGFTSGAFWLVFGGLVIGCAIEDTGLGARIAGGVVHRVTGSYGAVIAGIIAVNMMLGFLMPSCLSRVVLLLPIVIALAEKLGYSLGSRPANGMIMASVLTAYLCSTSVLPSNVPNNILMGAAEASFGLEIRYFDYLALHYPILGLLKSLFIWGAVVWLFRGESAQQNKKSKTERVVVTKHLSAPEYRLGCFVGLALIFWATDFFHGVAPAWVSLAAAFCCLAPGLGMISPKTFQQKVKIGALIYVAGIIGIGAVVTETGLGEFVSRNILSSMELSGEGPFKAYTALSSLAMMLGMVSTMPGVPAILVPMSEELSVATGLNLNAVLMSQVVGFSTVWFPYQVPPIIVGMQLGAVPMLDGIKVTALIALISVIILNPLNSLWWQLLGYLPEGGVW